MVPVTARVPLSTDGIETARVVETRKTSNANDDSICEIAEIEMFTRNTDMSGKSRSSCSRCGSRSEVTQGSDCFGQVW
jgi:hypothetical protein